MASGSRSQEKITIPELPMELPYDFLKKITNNFAEDLKISGGHFGALYKGIHPDNGKMIAVKKFHENAQMPPEKLFNAEVQNIISLKHENIVQLVGFCCERQKKLVQLDKRYIQADIIESLLCYEYLPMGSLQENLFGKKETKGDSPAKPNIDWDTRFKIIKGICEGLYFLQKLDNPIIHTDLKPESILLDANMVPKITDFMLSEEESSEEILMGKKIRLGTRTDAGSYAYMAPEYLYRGEISAESDIYSLGLMIIEITTGEKNCPKNNQPCARNFIEKVQNIWTLEHIISENASLPPDGLQQVAQCIKIGLECVCLDRKFRPHIGNIVARLNGLNSR